MNTIPLYNRLLFLLLGCIFFVLILTLVFRQKKIMKENFTTDTYKITSEENKICLELLGGNVNFSDVGRDLQGRKLSIVEINKVNSLISKIKPYHLRSIQLLNKDKVKKFHNKKKLKKMSRKRRRKYLRRMRKRAMKNFNSSVKNSKNLKDLKKNNLKKKKHLVYLKKRALYIIRYKYAGIGGKHLKFAFPLSIEKRTLLLEKLKNLVIAVKQVDDEANERSILDEKHIEYRKLYYETFENYENIYRRSKLELEKLNSTMLKTEKDQVGAIQRRVGEKYIKTRINNFID